MQLYDQQQKQKSQNYMLYYILDSYLVHTHVFLFLILLAELYQRHTEKYAKQQ